MIDHEQMFDLCICFIGQYIWGCVKNFLGKKNCKKKQVKKLPAVAPGAYLPHKWVDLLMLVISLGNRSALFEQNALLPAD